MPQQKKSSSYLEAKSMLSPALQVEFEAFLTDYKFACLKHHGWEFASPKVLAELILMGWRNSTATSKINPKKRDEHLNSAWLWMGCATVGRQRLSRNCNNQKRAGAIVVSLF
jgi:hypothetical protein